MINKKLANIFFEVFEVNELTITEETKQIDIENWDSIGHLRLIMTVEEKYGIKFLTQEMQKIDSVAVLNNLIEEKINRK